MTLVCLLCFVSQQSREESEGRILRQLFVLHDTFDLCTYLPSSLLSYKFILEKKVHTILLFPCIADLVQQAEEEDQQEAAAFVF